MLQAEQAQNVEIKSSVSTFDTYRLCQLCLTGTRNWKHGSAHVYSLLDVQHVSGRNCSVTFFHHKMYSAVLVAVTSLLSVLHLQGLCLQISHFSLLYMKCLLADLVTISLTLFLSTRGIYWYSLSRSRHITS